LLREISIRSSRNLLAFLVAVNKFGVSTIDK
jgi:hypothetical protein